MPGVGDPSSWQRWIFAVLDRTRLRGLGGERLDDVWLGAARTIGARLLISFARERLFTSERRAGALTVELGPGRDPIVLPLARLGAFELDRAAIEVVDPALDRWLADPLALVDLLELDVAARARVRAELASSVEHLATARLARSLRSLLAAEPGHADDPRLTEPEHFVTDGHPWHPMTRTRIGLGRADSLRHAPELLARCPISIVEIDERIARVSGEWRERIGELSPDLEGRPGWVRVPVHPVQLRRLPKAFPELWGDRIRVVAAKPIAARPLLSLRTIEWPGGLHHVKLSLGIHTTSARRVVSPMSVRDGPTITALIQSAQASDPETRPLALIPEPAAIGLEPTIVGAKAKELGAILRPLPPSPGRAWVCAALAETWPGTDETVFERACAGLPGDRASRIDTAIGIWIDGLVAPALRLFVAHGIALELHLQNTLVVVDHGRPIGFWVRDLGGIRLHRERLRRAGHQPSFDPDSFVITDDLDEVRGKLAHSLFHAHLTYLFELAESLGVSEASCWARSAQAMTQLLDRWAQDPRETDATREAARLERDRLFAPQVQAKALFRMRLSEAFSDYEYTTVDNRLHVHPAG